MQEITYELKTSFKYHHKGEQHEAKSILLFAPTMKHLKFREPLKQAFFQAAVDIAERQGVQDKIEESTKTSKPESDDQSDNEFDNEVDDVLGMIRASHQIDTYKVTLNFIQLLISKGIAMVDGSEPMTQKIVDDMDPEDFDNLMGVYLGNFIAASS